MPLQRSTYIRQINPLKSLEQLSIETIWKNPELTQETMKYFANCRVRHLLKKPLIEYKVCEGFPILLKEENLSAGLVNVTHEPEKVIRHIPVKIHGINDEHQLDKINISRDGQHHWYFITTVDHAFDPNNFQHPEISLMIAPIEASHTQLEVLVHFKDAQDAQIDPSLKRDYYLEWQENHYGSSQKEHYIKTLLRFPQDPVTKETILDYWQYHGINTTHQKVKILKQYEMPVIPKDTPLGVVIAGDILNKDELDPRYCIAVRPAPETDTLDLINNQGSRSSKIFMQCTGTILIYENAVLEVEVVGIKPIQFNLIT